MCRGLTGLVGLLSPRACPSAVSSEELGTESDLGLTICSSSPSTSLLSGTGVTTECYKNNINLLLTMIIIIIM